jgi:hypothetical protein
MFIAWGKTFDTDDQGLPTAAVVVGVGVTGIENMVKQLDTMQVAGMHAENDSAWFQARRLDFEFLGVFEFEKRLLGGQEKFLWRQDGCWVIQPQFSRISDGFEGEMTVSCHRSTYVVDPQQIPHKGCDVLLAKYYEAHFHLLRLVDRFPMLVAPVQCNSKKLKDAV